MHQSSSTSSTTASGRPRVLRLLLFGIGLLVIISAAAALPIWLLS